MCTRKGILFDWVGVLVLPGTRIDEGGDPQSLAASFEAFEPLWTILPSLADHFKMCVVNNGPASTIPHFEERFGFSRFLDFVNSELEGTEKPHPQIYQRACARLNLSPDQCLYMDDNTGFPQETIDLGMEFIWWQTPEKGFEDFKQWLIRNGVPYT